MTFEAGHQDGKRLAETGLPAVLTLMYSARSAYSTVHAKVRNWWNPRKQGEASALWARSQPPGTVALINGPDVQAGEGLRQRAAQIWATPTRVRHQTEVDYSKELRITLVNRSAWWVYDPLSGIETNVGSPHAEAFKPSFEDELVLDPSALLAELWMTVVDTAEVGGREAIYLTALPRREGFSAQEPVLWAGATSYELYIDAAKGTLLRLIAYLDDEGFAGFEVPEIVFDQPISEEVFAPEFPKDAPVRVADTEPLRRPRQSRRWRRRLPRRWRIGER